eukprot:s1575_g8.t1
MHVRAIEAYVDGDSWLEGVHGSDSNAQVAAKHQEIWSSFSKAEKLVVACTEKGAKHKDATGDYAFMVAAKKILPVGMEIPSSFEQAGHIAHMNLRDSQLPYKHLIGQVILDKNKSIKTVVNKVGRIETEFRTFAMEVLAGEESTVVRLKEHQCFFEFEYRDVYWNSRLQEEHGRLIEALFMQPKNAASAKPVLADCTCGVGPFSLPIVKLVNGVVSHANDLNPASIRWLRKSCALNKMEENVVEVESLPHYSDFFAAPASGSLLVIHEPGDARQFVPDLFHKRHPVTHAVFNLPAAGVELLDCFRGLDYPSAALPTPLVCCYTFSDAAVDSGGSDGCVADLLARLAAALGLPKDVLRCADLPLKGQVALPSPQINDMVQQALREQTDGYTPVAVRLVRNVAPTRHMFCVCFRVPRRAQAGGDEDMPQVFTGIYKNTLRGHKMGVRCMAFATSTKVLVTGGYDYNLFVWNPYGHGAPVVGIEVLGAASNQVVSADSEGFVKTWDLGTYQMIQSFYVDEVTILRAFVSIPSYKRVIVVEREFIAFDYENTGIPDQTEEEPLIKVFYNERLKVFVSGTISVVKIWDAVTGAIQVVIPHKDAEITDFCFDDRGRKLFVSDHLGDIHVYHSSTGCCVKKLTSHAKEVSGMIYCPGDKSLVLHGPVSWDRSIAVHDESGATAAVHRRATNAHKGDITCVAYSRHLGLIATGSTDCVIAVREYLKLRILACLLGHKSGVTTLAFVEPYPLLVSADYGGNVAVWAVPSLSGKDHKLHPQYKHWFKLLKQETRFINMQSLESSASVNCLDFWAEADSDNRTLVLYTGDEDIRFGFGDGEVRTWDLSALLSTAGLQPTPPIPEADWDPYKRVENDASHTAETVARNAASLEVPELPAMMDQPLVRQGLSWKAHTDSLRSLKVYSNPPCLVTAGKGLRGSQGFDGMAKIWARDGTLISVLRAYGQTPWHFPAEERIYLECLA